MPLGGHVQAHGFRYFGAKAPGEPAAANLFVMRVHGPVGNIARNIVDEVSDVMQKRGNDEPRRCAPGSGKEGGLQGMLGHRHALAQIRVRAALLIDGENLVGDVHEGASGWSSRCNSAASLCTLSRVR